MLKEELQASTPHLLSGIAEAADLLAENRAFVSENGLPTSKLERWRYSDLTKMLKDVDFTSGTSDVPAPKLDDLAVKDTHRLVFAGGKLLAEYSDLANVPDGVEILSWRDAVKDSALVLPYIERASCWQDNQMVAHNLAHMSAGVVIKVKEGVSLDRPILIYYADAAAHKHLLQLSQFVVTGCGQ